MAYKRLKSKHKLEIEERLNHIRALCKEHKWEEIWHQEDNRKLRFQRDDDFFDIFYTTMTLVSFTINENYQKGMENELTQTYSKIENEDELIEVLV
jgi:hypothetical protein